MPQPVTYNPFSNRQIDPAVATRLGTTEQTVQVISLIEQIRTGVLPEFIILGWGSPARNVAELDETRLQLPSDAWWELVSVQYTFDNLSETNTARLAFFIFGKNAAGNDMIMGSWMSYYEVNGGQQRTFAAHPGGVLHTSDPLGMFVLEPLPAMYAPPGANIGFSVRSAGFLAASSRVYNLRMVWRRCGVSRPGA